MGRSLSNVRPLRPDAPRGLHTPAIYDRTTEKPEAMVSMDRNALEYLARHAEESLLLFEAGQGRAPRALQWHKDCIKVAADALGRKP